MANFETVKMLAKEIPFLLDNVLRIRFYFFYLIVSYIRTIWTIIARKTQTENLIVLPLLKV